MGYLRHLNNMLQKHTSCYIILNNTYICFAIFFLFDTLTYCCISYLYKSRWMWLINATIPSSFIRVCEKYGDLSQTLDLGKMHWHSTTERIKKKKIYRTCPRPQFCNEIYFILPRVINPTPYLIVCASPVSRSWLQVACNTYKQCL